MSGQVEKTKDVASEINLMSNEVEIKEKIFKLVTEMDKTEDGLNILFSRHSNDIGMMADGIKPYTPLMFTFPIVPGADLTPQSEKCRFINKNL